jgi:hypothetical protein
MARDADEMLDDLATRQPDPRALRSTLYELADFVLCWRHKEQTEKIVRLWEESVGESFSSDVTEEESEDESEDESDDSDEEESDDESAYGSDDESEDEGTEAQEGDHNVEYRISGLLQALQLTPRRRRH